MDVESGSMVELRRASLVDADGKLERVGGEVTILVDSGFTSSDYPYTSTDTVVFAKPDTMRFETGKQSLLSNQHYQSKSLGAPRPPLPYNWVYKWQS